VERLINRASAAFGVEPSSLKVLKGGTYNKVFEYTLGAEAYVLRLAPQDSDSVILREMLHYMKFLSDNGMAVPCPVKSIQGKYIETFSEDRTYAAHSFLKLQGSPADDLEPHRLTEPLFRDIGALVGKMHGLSRRYDPLCDASVPNWSDTSNVFCPLATLDTAPPPIRAKYDSAFRSILSLPKPSGSFGIIHTDAHLANIVVANDATQVGLVDFDDFSHGWHVMDVAVTLFDALVVVDPDDDVAFGTTFLTGYLSGYLAQNHLDPFWIEQIPAFLKLIETSIYIEHGTDLKTGDTTSWLGKFMRNRRYRILNDTPYIARDWEKIAENAGRRSVG
jgi:Ser/Thr protein kinase RdoA (MazF antagonist)